jgi:hypothetical protein
MTEGIYPHFNAPKKTYIYFVIQVTRLQFFENRVFIQNAQVRQVIIGHFLRHLNEENPKIRNQASNKSERTKIMRASMYK